MGEREQERDVAAVGEADEVRARDVPLDHKFAQILGKLAEREGRLPARGLAVAARIDGQHAVEAGKDLELAGKQRGALAVAVQQDEGKARPAFDAVK